MKTLKINKNEPLRCGYESEKEYKETLDKFYADTILNHRNDGLNTKYIHWENTGWLRYNYSKEGSTVRGATSNEINSLK